MNILYFGPFRYDNNFGFSSRNLIQCLESQHKVCLHHIFLNNPYENTTIINLNRNNYTQLLNHYDYIIEHCPIDMMHVDRSLSDNYIALPITSEYTIDKKQASILNQFDKVLSDDILQTKLLEGSKISCQSLSYNFAKEDNDNKFNINFHHHFFNRKFYFLGNFKDDHAIIQKIIISFIIAFRSRQDVSLILICSDDNESSAGQAISEMLESICKKMRYSTTLLPIKIIFQKLSYQQLHYIHKNCDILLDIHDTYQTGINKQLAMLYHKNIINISNLQLVRVPSIENVNSEDITYKYSILTDSLIRAMTNTITKQITITDNNTKLINSILC